MNKNKIPVKKKELFFAGNTIAASVLSGYLVFIAMEVTAGLGVHSASLLANAGLNLLTLSVFVLSILAFRLLKIKSGEKYKKQYRAALIVIILLNVKTALLTLGIVIFQQVNRKFIPQPELPLMMGVLGITGLLLNAMVLFIFRKEKQNDFSIQIAWDWLRNNFFFFAGLILLALGLSHWKWRDLDIGYGFVMLAIILFYGVNLLQRKLHIE